MPRQSSPEIQIELILGKENIWVFKKDSSMILTCYQFWKPVTKGIIPEFVFILDIPQL